LNLKNILKNSFLLFISTFIPLACVELGFYFYGEKFFLWQTNQSWITQLDEELVYSLQPNKIGHFKQDEFVEKSRINSFGLRDKEIDKYSKYDKRIIVLGDSFTYGYGVNNGQTYSDFLESFFFREDGKKIDVVNAGVHGYGTDQEYKLYKTRLYEKLRHDVLIIGINANDIDDNIGNPLYTIDNNLLKPLDATKTWIYFLTNVYQKSPGIIKRSYTFNFILSRLKNKDIFSLLPDLDKKGLIKWSKRKILLEIEDLKRMTKKKGIKFVVYTVPMKNTSPNAYDWLIKNKTTFSDSDILFLDIAKGPVWKEKKSELFFQKDPHLNKNGYFTLGWEIYYGIKGYIN
tara:strand:+ start:2486 stop:3520 length:1035 start_codon:yes stop_codon:yes gene_type:complete